MSLDSIENAEDNETINTINNECFQFVQHIWSKWQQHNSTTIPCAFGSHLSLGFDNLTSNCVVPVALNDFNHFQSRWSSLLSKIKKAVVKNIKRKKNADATARPTPMQSMKQS